MAEAPPPLPVAPAIAADPEHTPPVFSVCGLAGGSARSTTAVELACGLSQDGTSVLLVDASPFHTAALLLGLPDPEPDTVQVLSPALRYVWLRQPTLARLRQLSLAENPQQVILNLPLEHNEQNTALLSASQGLLLTLPLRPQVLSQLARQVQYLHRVLSSHLPAWFGVLPVRYQADNALQTQLLATLRAEYPQLILPMAVPETAAVHQALLSQPADLQPYQAAYQAVIKNLKESRLARL
jgi:cellulose biosynthesis protein BcsQ